MKNFVNKHAKIIGIILGYFIASIFLDLLFKNILPIKVANYLSPLIIVVLLFLLFKNDIVTDAKKFKGNWKALLKKYIKYYLVAYLLSTVCNAIICLIVGSMSTNNELITDQFHSFPIYSIIETVFMAPFIEEVIFRLNIKKGYKRKVPFVLISGCIFGSLHLLVSTSLLELLFAIPYCILGCMLSLVYYDSDNIFASIMIHSLNNLLATIVIIGGIL